MVGLLLTLHSIKIGRGLGVSALVSGLYFDDHEVVDFAPYHVDRL